MMQLWTLFLWLDCAVNSLGPTKTTRRHALANIVLIIPSMAGPAANAAIYDNGPSRPANLDVILPGGVNVEDLREGTGVDIVQVGNRVNVQYSLKRSNGYSVDSSAEHDGVPFIFTVGDKHGAIQGLDEGIRGMKIGGIRRILIPPSLAYVDGVEDGKPGPVPQGFGPKQRIRRVMELLKEIPGEYIVLDIKLTRIQ